MVSRPAGKEFFFCNQNYVGRGMSQDLVIRRHPSVESLYGFRKQRRKSIPGLIGYGLESLSLFKFALIQMIP